MARCNLQSWSAKILLQDPTNDGCKYWNVLHSSLIIHFVFINILNKSVNKNGRGFFKQLMIMLGVMAQTLSIIDTCYLHNFFSSSSSPFPCPLSPLHFLLFCFPFFLFAFLLSLFSFYFSLSLFLFSNIFPIAWSAAAPIWLPLVCIALYKLFLFVVCLSRMWPNTVCKNIQERALAIMFPDVTYDEALVNAGLSTLANWRVEACNNFISKIKPDNPVFNLIRSRVVYPNNPRYH